MSSNPATQLGTKAAHILIGFLVACGVAATVFTLQIAISAIVSAQSAPIEWDELLLGAIGGVGMMFLLTCVVALPGFALLRLILWLLQRTGWPSFSIAGALNAVLVVSIFAQTGDYSFELFIKYPPSPIVPLIGGLAGAAACLTERYFARRSAMKAGAA